MADLRSSAENPGPIRIPQWDDVIHIAPRPTITNHDRALWLRNWPHIRARDSSPGGIVANLSRLRSGEITIEGLDPEVQADLARRTQLGYAMRESAIPEWRQKMIRILTQIDNLEDDLSTFERLSRPILARIPGGPLLSRVMRGTSTTMDRIERVIAGPTIYGRRQKNRSIQERTPNARKRTGIMGALQSGLAWLGRNWGALLEGAQSSDTHLGVGLQLGAIYGALEEAQDRALISAWNAGKWAVATYAQYAQPWDPILQEVMQQQRDAAIQRIRETGVPLVEQLGRAAATYAGALSPVPALLAAQQLIAVGGRTIGALWSSLTTRESAGASYVSQDNPHYSAGEHALALHAAARANAWNAQVLRAASSVTPLHELDQLDAPRARVRNPFTAELVAELGGRIDARGYAIGDWAERTITVGRAVDRGISDYLRHHDAWLPEPDAGAEAALMHALAESNLPTVAAQLTGSADGLTDIWEPDIRAELMLYHLGTYPPQQTSRDRIAAWLRDQVNYIEQHPDDYDERAAARLTQSHWAIASTIPT